MSMRQRIERGSSSIQMQPGRTRHRSRVDVGSDDCVSAGLIDELPQTRNELCIEILCGTPVSGVHPVFCALKASATASSGGIEPDAASVRRPDVVDRPKDRHPAIDAEDVHGDLARLMPPDRSVWTAEPFTIVEGARGSLPKNKKIK